MKLKVGSLQRSAKLTGWTDKKSKDAYKSEMKVGTLP